MTGQLLLVRVLLLCGLAFNFAATAEEFLEVKIMSFNVRWDGLDQGEDSWTNRRPLAVEVIRRHAPDVVALQEASPAQTADLDIDLADYQAHAGSHERDQHLSLLYSTNGFQLADHGSFWLVEESDLPGGTRRCVWIRLIERDSGRGFYVFNNHWDHRSADSRQQSARALIEGIRSREHSDPFVIAGDFNETAKGSALQILLRNEEGSTEGNEPGKELFDLVDTFRTANPNDFKSGTGNGFTGRTNGSRIDYIFVQGQDKVTGARILRDHEGDRYPSDHFPITATVELSPSASQD